MRNWCPGIAGDMGEPRWYLDVGDMEVPTGCPGVTGDIAVPRCCRRHPDLHDMMVVGVTGCSDLCGSMLRSGQMPFYNIVQHRKCTVFAN